MSKKNQKSNPSSPLTFLKNDEETNQMNYHLAKLDSEIQTINNKLSDELTKILVALDKKQPMAMSVIIEEETERSVNEDQPYSYDNKDSLEDYICNMSNRNLCKLEKMSNQIDKLLKIYADQMYSLCQQIYNWQSKNRQLNEKYKKIKQKCEKISRENEELKDQITAMSSEYLVTKNQDEQYQELFKDEKKALQNCNVRKSSKTKVRISQSDTIIRKEQKLPIKKVQKQNSNTNNLDDKKEKEKWKQLSTKVNELKSKLIIYEEQIQEKDYQIKDLMNKIKQKQKHEHESEEDERRKLKKFNTNLRGEKTILNNQINSLKKSLNERNQYCQVQQQQIQQFKSQIISLNQTIKFQKALIDQLKQNINSKKSEKHEESLAIKQSQVKIQKLQHKFSEFVCQQQCMLEKFCETIDHIEVKYFNNLKEMQQTIKDLQSILEEKNEYIVAIKTKERNQERTHDRIDKGEVGYYSELIKNLTKKVAQKEEIIRLLRAK